jgi:hypothetical protein
MREFIDETIFLGMHSTNEAVRISCKNFFVERLAKTIFMSLESVGKCDDIVWQFNREVQDIYYPFMDRLHTVMDIRRSSYSKTILKDRKETKKLSFYQELTVAQAKGGRLYTLDKKLLGLGLGFIKLPRNSKDEKSFPPDIEKWYKKSLKLRISL